MPHALGSGDGSDLHDVPHNIFKEEVHTVNKEQKRLLVHRKGATRAFPPGRNSDFFQKKQYKITDTSGGAWQGMQRCQRSTLRLGSRSWWAAASAPAATS